MNGEFTTAVRTPVQHPNSWGRPGRNRQRIVDDYIRDMTTRDTVTDGRTSRGRLPLVDTSRGAILTAGRTGRWRQELSDQTRLVVERLTDYDVPKAVGFGISSGRPTPPHSVASGDDRPSLLPARRSRRPTMSPRPMRASPHGIMTVSEFEESRRAHGVARGPRKRLRSGAAASGSTSASDRSRASTATATHHAVSRSWAAVVDRHHVHRHVRRVNTTAVPYPLAPAAGLFPDSEQYTPVRGAGVHRVRTPSARLRRLEWFTTPGSTRSETDSAYDKRTVPS